MNAKPPCTPVGRPLRPAAQAPAAAAPLAPAAGTVGPAARPGSADRARRRRPAAAAGADARRAGRARGAGRSGGPGRAARGGRDAAEELLRRLVDAGVLVDADEPDRVARQRAAAGRHRGGRRTARGRDRHRARARRRRQRVDRGGRRRRGAGGRSRARVCSTATAAGRPSTRSWTWSGGSRRARAPGRPPARAAPDLCVLADAVVPEPTRLAALHRDRVAHLPVRLRDGTGIVGPLVLPGRSACLGCVELHRCARDPGWPAVTAQLVGRPGRGSAAAAAATAALGVAQVLAALDVAGGRGAACSTGARRHAGARPRLGRAAAPPVAGAPGLHVWRTTVRADMRAARRTGDNHEVMSAARPLK